LRIGIDATCLPPVAAGVSRYLSGLIRGLAAVDRRNEYFVFIKAKNRNLLNGLPENVHAALLPNFTRPLRIVYQHFIAAAYARRLNLDLWHGTHYGLPQFSQRLRLVSTFHDLSFIEFPQFFSAGKRFYFQQALANAARRAEVIVCVSEATRVALQRHFSVNGCALTVHSGVDPIFFQPVAEAEIKRVGRKRNIDDPYVFFLGTIEHHKNLLLALRAFAALRQRGREKIKLVIAGQPGSGWPAAAKLIRELGLADSVHMLGYVPEQELPAMYQGARLLILPSFAEGFGFPLLEAMAGGVPVLAAQTASGGAPAELVNHPKMLCEHDVEQWAAKMEELICNEPLRRELAVYAVNRAKQFCWTTTAQRMVEIYESLGAPQRMTTSSHRVVSSVQNADLQERKNGKSYHLLTEPASPQVISAVLRTLIYADLFDYPLLQQEVHLGLLECSAQPEEVAGALEHLGDKRVVGCSAPDVERPVLQWWHLPERQATVAERRRRREHTRKLWQKNSWALERVCRFPLVKGVALSGAAAFENCQPADDIDLFIIAGARRLWLTYAALVLFLKAIGKRRLICLNYLIGDQNLAIPPGRERDFFVAHQIAFLRVLKGRDIFHKYFSANQWTRQFLPQTAWQSPAPSGLPMAGEKRSLISRVIESLLDWRLFDFLEYLIYRIYSKHILRIAGHHRDGSVEVSPGCIKLFTNNHRQRLRENLERRFEEIWKSYAEKNNAFAAVHGKS